MTDLLAKPILATAQDSERRVIAVASGKGGVGKTWLSLTLAHGMAARGVGGLVFDADCGLANIDIQLGLTPAYDLCDVVTGGIPLEQAIARPRAPDGRPAGFSVLPGRSGAAALSGLSVPALDALLTALRELAGYDVVLLDLGAGIERVTRRLAAWADTLLVVTTEEPTALTDAYAVLKLHARDHRTLASEQGARLDARIIVNQATSVLAGERAFATLAKACTTFLGHTPKLAGIIRKDPNVGETIRRQALMLSRHPSSTAIQDVERILENLLAAVK